MALDILFFFHWISVNLVTRVSFSLPRMNGNAQNLRWDVNSWQRPGKAQMGDFCGLCPSVTSPPEEGSAASCSSNWACPPCRISPRNLCCSSSCGAHTSHAQNFWHTGPASQKQLTPPGEAVMAIFWQIREALRHWALSWAAAAYLPWHRAEVNDLCGQASQPEGGIRHHLFLLLLDPEKSSGLCNLGYSNFLPGPLIIALIGDPWLCILQAVAMSTWLLSSSCGAYWKT